MGLSYSEWNDLIAKYYFNEKMAGREVILFANSDLIESLGKPYDADFNDFIRKLKIGPIYVPKSYKDIYQIAYDTYKFGKKYNSPYPPYIAYLTLFVCASTIDGNFDDKAYYPRLAKLLGEEEKYPKIHTTDMKYLWEDLEKWSKNIKGEELGIFTKRVRGGNVHIGIPLSQTIISEKERANLPLFFSIVDLDPDDLPSDTTLKIKLKTYGNQYFQRRTLGLLDSPRSDDKHLSEALIDFVLEELDKWDGKVSSPVVEMHEEPALHSVKHSEFTKVYLRVCLTTDFTGYLYSLRIKTKEEYPDNNLEFKVKGREARFTCSETNQPEWSRRLEEQVNGHTVTADALQFDWLEGIDLRDEDNKWLAKMRSSNVRVFLPGSFEGLNEEWVESQHLEYGCKFLVACHDSCRNEIFEWGQSNTEAFEEKKIYGLPINWSLFFGKNAANSYSKYEALSLPQKVRLRLKGGVKVGKGNQYLNFAPPYLVLEGAQGDESLTVGGIELFGHRAENLQRYMLPEDLEIGETLSIEVTKDGEKVCNTRTVKLVEPFLIEDFSQVPKRDNQGGVMEEIPSSLSFVQGSVVYGCKPQGHVPIGLPTYLSHRIIFLGSIPGQFVNWPDDELPRDWNPIWGVAKFGQKWEVNFCGAAEDLKNPPSTKEKVESKKKVKKWREYIWGMRRTVKDPTLPLLKELWSIYKEVAKNVRS